MPHARLFLLHLQHTLVEVGQAAGDRITGGSLEARAAVHVEEGATSSPRLPSRREATSLAATGPAGSVHHQ